MTTKTFTLTLTPANAPAQTVSELPQRDAVRALWALAQGKRAVELAPVPRPYAEPLAA